MSQSDLPQPIYPTQPADTDQARPDQAEDAPAPEAPAPWTPPPAPAPSPEAPSPARAGGPDWVGWLRKPAVILGVVALLAVGGTAVALGGDGEGGGDSPSDVRGGDVAGDDSGDGGDGDVGARAQEVAAAQFEDLSGSSVDCLAGELEQDPTLLSLLERSGEVVQTNSPTEARSLAETVMDCASPDEVTAAVVDGYRAEGSLTDFQVDCIEADLSTWDESLWVDWLELSFQPSQLPSIQAYLNEVLTYC